MHFFSPFSENSRFNTGNHFCISIFFFSCGKVIERIKLTEGSVL